MELDELGQDLYLNSHLNSTLKETHVSWFLVVHFTKLSELFKLNNINVNVIGNDPFKVLKEATARRSSRNSAERPTNNVSEPGTPVFLSYFKSGASRTWISGNNH
jgi:hypothetical protein